MRPACARFSLHKAPTTSPPGIAPFISRRAFEAVTGPKLDWWLVQTVGALVTAAGGALLSAAHQQRITPELLGIGAGSAASLAAIDVVYVAKGRIAPSYLVDAAVQLGLLGALAVGVGRESTDWLPAASGAG
jgi:hypothetical protein